MFLLLGKEGAHITVLFYRLGWNEVIGLDVTACGVQLHLKLCWILEHYCEVITICCMLILGGL